TRSPAGTGSCCAMISFTLATAVGVRVMGVGFGVDSAGFTSGVVVVAMGISFTKQIIAKLAFSQKRHVKPRFLLDAGRIGPGSETRLRPSRAGAKQKTPSACLLEL